MIIIMRCYIGIKLSSSDKSDKLEPQNKKMAFPHPPIFDATINSTFPRT